MSSLSHFLAALNNFLWLPLYILSLTDGSWLAHLGRVTGTVSAMPVQPDEKPPTQQEQEAWAQEWRRAARSSWQVMSEELGDGDLERSHVGAYERLMDQLASAAGEVAPPKGEDRAFTEWLGAGTPPSPDNPSPDTEGNDRCWRAAVVQLALSVSPNELLPESLGFNASYEGLPYHLLVSARELTELGFDAYCEYWAEPDTRATRRLLTCASFPPQTSGCTSLSTMRTRAIRLWHERQLSLSSKLLVPLAATNSVTRCGAV